MEFCFYFIHIFISYYFYKTPLIIIDCCRFPRTAGWLQRRQQGRLREGRLQSRRRRGSWRIQVIFLQIIITRMHSSRMRTARFSGRFSCNARPPAMHASRDTHTPLPQKAPPPPLVNRITDRCKTLPSRNFVCGRLKCVHRVATTLNKRDWMYNFPNRECSS